jgi:hypothetical protein
MIRSVKIEGYRGLKEFSLSELGRINLIVGKNSAGKTSVLEAVELFAAKGHPMVLSDILTRRGEVTRPLMLGRLEYLFYGYGVFTESCAVLSGVLGDEPLTVPIKIEFDANSEQISLRCNGHSVQLNEELRLPLWNPRKARLQRREPEAITATTFLPTSVLTADRFIRVLDQILLTEDEPFFLQALQFIEPAIEQVMALTDGESRGRSVYTKLTGVTIKVPLHNLGDGIWRLGTLALGLISARGGVLLVDEIDSGLHYSVMESMWRMIIKTARRFDIQVFATTHSQDCLDALAAVCETLEDPSDITLQRIKADRTEAIAYNAASIISTADRGVEVR